MQKSVDKVLGKAYNNIRDVERYKNSSIRYHSPIVQSVEHLTVNQGVVGSSPTRGATWPVGQAVKTPPFHGGIGGSIPPPVTTKGRLAQLGERLPYKQNVSGSIPLAPTTKFSTSISRSAFFVCPSTSSKKYI